MGDQMLVQPLGLLPQGRFALRRQEHGRSRKPCRLRLGLGAGLMYLFDPHIGRRRRAHLRNQLSSAFGRIDDCMDMTSRDVSQRTQGLLAEIRSWFVDQQIPDEVLVARLRSKLGRYVSHPSSIAITAGSTG